MVTKHKTYKIILLILTGLTVALNLLALIPAFNNYYADNIYGYINKAVGTVTGPVPLAVGEIIMYLAGALVILFIILAVVFLFRTKHTSYRRFFFGYSRSVLLIAVITVLIYTTNWLIPFRSDPIYVSDNTRTEFTFEEMAAVYGMVVTGFNETAELVPRDEEGRVDYSSYTDADIARAMKQLGGDYVRLRGRYSPVKEAICSPFLDWMNIGGYNYIYTMEPTYNKYVTPLYMPTLKAHEYVHHKGYFKENEGEFLSSLAMVNSDEPLLRYSGYYEMYRYLTADFADYLDLLPRLSDRVKKDISDSFDMADELYKNEVSEAMEDTFKEASGRVADKGWEIQGDILKENTYDGLTLMLLQYYTE